VRRARMKEGCDKKGERAAAGAFYGGLVARQRGKGAGGPGVGAAWREGNGEERWGTRRGGGQLWWSASALGQQARVAPLPHDIGGWIGRGDSVREQLTGGAGRPRGPAVSGGVREGRRRRGSAAAGADTRARPAQCQSAV
jgi:hypothetical protein